VTFWTGARQARAASNVRQQKFFAKIFVGTFAFVLKKIIPKKSLQL